MGGPQTLQVVSRVHAGERFGQIEYRCELKYESLDRTGKDEMKIVSGWVRVSSLRAGSGFGWCSISRVGEEVVVDFVDGHPDRPVVIGTGI